MYVAIEHFISAAAANNTHFLLIQALLTVIGALVIAAVLWTARAIAKRIDKMETRTHTTTANVNAILAILETQPPSALNPHPRKGMVEVVGDHTKTLSTLLDGTKELVADKAQNDGSTSRDALNRIEKEQVRVAENLARDEEIR